MVKKFYKVKTISQALKLKKDLKDNALFYAGGTEINRYNNNSEELNVISTELLKLNRIEKNEDEIIIEASVTFQQLLDSKSIPESLKTAAKNMINRNIRNMATIGGNIATNKSCGSLIPLLIALNSSINIVSINDDKLINIYEYIKQAKTTYTNHLITKIIIPSNQNRKVTLKHFTRTSNDITVLNVAVSSENSDTPTNICIAIGGVSEHVVRLTQLEYKLNGKNLPAKDELEKLVQNYINPISDIRGSKELKKHMAGVLITDCIFDLFKEGV